jgi:hypothetical protein
MQWCRWAWRRCRGGRGLGEELGLVARVDWRENGESKSEMAAAAERGVLVIGIVMAYFWNLR